jgi:hypothetical protein
MASLSVRRSDDPFVRDTTLQRLPMYKTSSPICQLTMSALGEGQTNSRPPGTSRTTTVCSDPLPVEEPEMPVMS